MRTEMVRQLQELLPAHPQAALRDSILSAAEQPLVQLQSCPLDDFKVSSGFLGSNRLETVWNTFRACGFSRDDDVVEPLPLGLQADGDEIATGELITSGV